MRRKEFWLSLVLAFAATAAGAEAMVLPSAAKQARVDEVICLIEPSLEVNVGTPVDGTLEVVNADRGDTVGRGQVLARLDVGVQLASAAVQEAKAAFGARKFDRNEDLQRQQLISSQELDEIATEQKLAELELKERREQIRLRTIVSPIHGVVVDRYRNRGDLVHQEKIFRIAQLDPLHVETVVPASYFGRIRVGQIYAVAPQLVGGRLNAKVAVIDRVIDAASGTFRVRLLLPNPKFELPSGQRCSINFNAIGTDR